MEVKLSRSVAALSRRVEDAQLCVA
jgi:hypothetical protein